MESRVEQVVWAWVHPTSLSKTVKLSEMTAKILESSPQNREKVLPVGQSAEGVSQRLVSGDRHRRERQPRGCAGRGFSRNFSNSESRARGREQRREAGVPTALYSWLGSWFTPARLVGPFLLSPVCQTAGAFVYWPKRHVWTEEAGHTPVSVSPPPTSSWVVCDRRTGKIQGRRTYEGLQISRNHCTGEKSSITTRYTRRKTGRTSIGGHRANRQRRNL